MMPDEDVQVYADTMYTLEAAVAQTLDEIIRYEADVYAWVYKGDPRPSDELGLCGRLEGYRRVMNARDHLRVRECGQ